jgi:hypothetical protein
MAAFKVIYGCFIVCVCIFVKYWRNIVPHTFVMIFWSVLGCSWQYCDVGTRLYMATPILFTFCFLSNLRIIVVRWFSEINCHFFAPVVVLHSLCYLSPVWIAEITHWCFRTLWTCAFWVHVTPLLKRLMSFALILCTWRVKFKAFSFCDLFFFIFLI